MNPTLEQIKTDESVWPEGASHYVDNTFTRWVDGDEYLFNNETKEWEKEWEEINFGLDYYMEDGSYIVIPRPTKAFVPEVGVKCEYSVNGGDWGSCSLIASYKDRHWIAINDIRKEAVWNSSVIKFRPIKSEREKFIEAASKILQLHDQDITDLCNKSVDMFRSQAEALYDSGKFSLKEPTK